LTLDQVKHVLGRLGWRGDEHSMVHTFLHYDDGRWTFGPTTVERGLVRIESFGGGNPKWIEPRVITSISEGLGDPVNR
jgi:hypothetical protein